MYCASVGGALVESPDNWEQYIGARWERRGTYAGRGVFWFLLIFMFICVFSVFCHPLEK